MKCKRFCAPSFLPSMEIPSSSSHLFHLAPHHSKPTSHSSLKTPNLNRFSPSHHIHIHCSSSNRRPTSRNAANWDSNAENTRYSQRFQFRDESRSSGSSGFRNPKRRRWWSDEEDDEEEEEEFDEDIGGRGGGGGILEDAIDSIWIFKVFRSYGWALPIIILSMLLATGPKAFLMALALPLGQSALSLVIDKVFGRAPSRRKRKPRSKRTPFARAASDVETREDGDGISGSSEERQGYQSWVATADEDSVWKKGGDQRRPSFGGWEDLDRGQESDKERKKRRKTSQFVEKGKLSRKRGRQKDTPLLFRLLIAVFPFLGSWTRFL